MDPDLDPDDSERPDHPQIGHTSIN
ncbi:uncharacterized protein DNG_02986 [Cephalotrichum gorgonifer]|uniref:Uncharacterized protein n=1 Tax=Cephalotrichum gorgonifer TaxID=2041049 RepID=A0AAE8ST81_9PEZI|nr:uncharacterized protein DNG_02986 [Cephalotrichum gorgonifer]